MKLRIYSNDDDDDDNNNKRRKKLKKKRKENKRKEANRNWERMTEGETSNKGRQSLISEEQRLSENKGRWSPENKEKGAQVLLALRAQCSAGSCSLMFKELLFSEAKNPNKNKA